MPRKQEQIAPNALVLAKGALGALPLLGSVGAWAKAMLIQHTKKALNWQAKLGGTSEEPIGAINAQKA